MNGITPYTLGSLFTGIGGIDLAFQWAGYNIEWQVEIDDYCNRVLARHWPAVPRYRDVRGITGRTGKGWRGYKHVRPVDVLAGGFPCTDISVAGRGAGIREGTRSGLWFEFARLIGELRPRVVFLENVAAITSRDGTLIAGDLAALGYAASWGVISAADAGAPHLRERWWCVAMADAESSGWKTRRAYSVGVQESIRQAHEIAYLSEPLAHPNGQRHEDGHEGWEASEHSECRQDVAHAESERTTTAQQPRRLCSIEFEGQDVGHASGAGLAQRQSQPGHDGTQQPPTERANGNGHGPGRRAFPGLGGDAHGLPAGLDGAGGWRGWPAGLGESQHAWEPPRTVPAGSVPHRAARLKALGNAVVPAVVYPLAVNIRAILETIG